MNNISKFLMHITTEENCNKIEKSKLFNISTHTAKHIQWLGNGVYFWDGNDDTALKLGTSLVKNKPNNRNKKLKKISILITVEEEKYLNLDNEKWERAFEKFLKEFFPEGKELLEMLKMYRMKPNLPHGIQNRIGKIFGSAINMFLEVLEKEKGIEIDLVAHYFYHGYRRRLLAARQEMDIRQYCVKNLDLLNKNFEKWEIEYIL